MMLAFPVLFSILISLLNCNFIRGSLPDVPPPRKVDELNLISKVWLPPKPILLGNYDVSLTEQLKDISFLSGL